MEMSTASDLPLALSRIHFPVTTLGPGRRIGIWFQGCSIRCPGCISMDTWGHAAANTTVPDVIEHCSRLGDSAEGVTISGGEPSEQPEALAALLEGLAVALRPETDVLLYSGRTVEELEPLLARLTGLVDALISEPYVASELQTRPLMGSDNQRLHLLTPLGKTRFDAYLRTRDERDDALDFLSDEEGQIWLAGIPRRNEMERLRNLLATEGVQIWTSEQRAT